jgi:hypothetical protein
MLNICCHLESLKGKRCCRQVKFYSGVPLLTSRWFCLSRILARRLNPAVLHPARSNCRIPLAGLRRRLARELRTIWLRLRRFCLLLSNQSPLSSKFPHCIRPLGQRRKARAGRPCHNVRASRKRQRRPRRRFDHALTRMSDIKRLIWTLAACKARK